MSDALEIMVTGRLVGGHPMNRHLITDDNDQPVMDPITGQQKTNVGIGIAIPKGVETDWKQTEWGQVIMKAAIAGWPNGEYNSPNFSWKVTDGDSIVPNKRGKVPNQKEGYPGHWVLWASTNFFVKCYHPGKYNPLTDQIKNEKEIKAGDYCRVGINTVANNIKGPVKSPGVYVNPSVFELSRAGQEIMLTSGMDAAAVFGGTAASIPPNAQLDTAVVALPPPVTTPAVPPPIAAAPPPPAAPPAVVHQMTAKAGGATYEQMIAQNWTDALLLEHGMMLNTSLGVQPTPSILNGQ